MGTERIKIRILVPMTIALVGLLGIFVTGAFRLLHHNLDEEVDRHLTSVRNILRAQHHDNLRIMSTAILNIKLDPDIRDAYLLGDRNKVVALLSAPYKELKQNHLISHVYIFDTTAHTFLRLHDTALFSDTVDHFTASSAIATQRPAYGLELCEHGQFMVRLVIPWTDQGKIIGYIELGKELTDIAKDIPSTLGISAISLIDKDHLNREAWESLVQDKRNVHAWDEYPDYIIADPSQESIPPAISDWLSRNGHDHTHARVRIDYDGSTYWTAFIPLVDAQAHEVGDLMVFFDATDQITETAHLLYSIAGFFVLIGLALFVSFFKMLGAIEQELTESRQHMIRESQNRLEIEKRHARELAAHVVELERARARAVNLTRQAEQARQIAEHAQMELRESQKLRLKSAPPAPQDT